MKKNVVASAVVAGLAVSLIGCGGSSSSSGGSAYQRVAPLDPQVATISIADPLGTPVATITQASDIELAATSVTTDGTTVTLALDATNNTGRLLFGGKAVVTDISNVGANTATTAASTGTWGGNAYAGFGIKAIDTDATASAEDSIVFSDIDTMDNPLVVTVTLPTDHSLAFGQDSSSSTGIEVVDVEGNVMVEVETDEVSYRGADSYDGAFNGGVSSADGRYVFGGSRNTANVIVLDTVTHELTTIPVPTAGAAGHVSQVDISPDGKFVYAVAHIGDHQYRWEGGGGIAANYIAKISVANMNVVSSRDISGDSGVESDRPRSIDLSEDGSLAVVSTVGAGEVMVINTGNLSVTKRFKSSSSMARVAAISPDGSTVYVGNMSDNNYSYDGNLEVFDVATGDKSTLTLTNQSTSDPKDIDFGPDGRLYYARGGNPVTVIEDPTAAVLVEASVGSSVEGIAFGAEGNYYYLDNSGDVEKYDITDDSLVADATNSSIGRHSLSVSAY